MYVLFLGSLSLATHKKDKMPIDSFYIEVDEEIKF